MDHLSLFELNKAIGEVLTKNLEPSYWVVAEIGEIRTNLKGHCYLELVEKEDNKIKAKTRATIWSYTYRNLSTWFHGITGQSLKAGMKILFNATIQFHEIYGFSLNIRDIDAQYTLGERAKKRQEIITQLQEDGVFDMNKELELPIVPQRLAIISSESAAGFGDFMDQLNGNEFDFQFETKLFNSIMQGDQGESSIINSMHQVFEQIDQFDLVAIIRGGGAALDLDCFDSYELGSHIAQFPIPVITGIGHERDETIADMVAHTKLKTPTAVAEFIISGCRNYELQLNERFMQVAGKFEQKIEIENAVLDQLAYKFQRSAQQILFDERSRLKILLNTMDLIQQKTLKIQRLKIDDLQKFISEKPVQHIHRQDEFLEYLEKALAVLDPSNVLKRGYSITMLNGKNVNRFDDIKDGSLINTITNKMEITSKYQFCKKRK